MHRRPDGPNAGTQRWRRLLFMHWPVDAAALRANVPAGLELDLFDGVAYVGVVPFAMEAVRPRFLPRFAALDFLETNVRTYVVDGRGRSGVYFFSLEAASRLAVAAARATFGLPYHYAHMQLAETGGAIIYTTTRASDSAARLHVRYRAGAAVAPSPPGSLQHFLVERYTLFVPRRGRLWSAEVHHAPYAVAPAEILEVEEGLVAAAGLPPVGGPPTQAHVSPGVDVEVFAPNPIG